MKIQELCLCLNFFSFCKGFLSQTWTIYGTAGEGKGPSLFLSISSTHLRTFRQFFPNFAIEMTTSQIFLIALLATTRLYSMRFTPLEKHHLIHCEQNVNFCLLDNSRFCYSNLTRGSAGFELVLTITVVLRANRLTKCASHPILFV